MHNNYYFLRQLSTALELKLKGTVISECFSQHREELIIRFETHGDPCYIKAALQSGFSCLSFPSIFHRAKKNSVDLFGDIIGLRVQHIQQFENERSFALIFQEGKALLFKMHGNRSNVIYFEENIVKDVFKKNITADFLIQYSELDRTIDWSYDAFVQNQQKLESLYFTFGKIVWKYLEENDFQKQALEKKWEMIQSVKSKLQTPSFFIAELDASLRLTLFEIGQIKKKYQHPVEAVNEFFHQYVNESAFDQQKRTILSSLKNKLSGSDNYYEKNLGKLIELETNSSYKTWADLVMANMHAIKTGTEKIVVNNFYTNLPTEIKLKKDLSPQKNAEVFYRKAKNQHIEIQRLQQSLQLKEKEIEKIKNNIQQIESSTDLKSLREQVNSLGLRLVEEKQSDLLPFHEFMHNGFKIYVGRNAVSNDILTFKYSYKEDLWLHAKDVAGSHVLIKYQAGKPFPKDVIERAGELAAYNSKRKTDSLCPVVVTPKKFVRKRKGDPAGAVVVDREEVIMVVPKL